MNIQLRGELNKRVPGPGPAIYVTKVLSKERYQPPVSLNMIFCAEDC